MTVMESALVESSGRLGGGRTCVDIEEVAWRPSEDGRFGWFGPQNYRVGRFADLGLKTGGQPDAAETSRRRARGIIAKFESRRIKVVKVACLSDERIKSWTTLPLGGIWDVCLM